MNIKCTLCVLLALAAATLSACGVNPFSSFSGSRIGSSSQLLLEYDSFNSSDSHVLSMEAGDILAINTENIAGRLNVKVEAENGWTVFDAKNLATQHYEIHAPIDGAYTCTVTGHRARGSVRIRNQSLRAVQSMENSYYQAQSGAAFALFQSPAFDRAAVLLDTEGPLVWQDDTFTKYEVLDESLTSTGTQELYCCAFTYGGGQYGCLILSYDGDRLEAVRSAETPCLYDLRCLRTEIKQTISENGLALPDITAARVQLSDGAEGILLTDASGKQAAYRFPG